jgi:DNA-binding response OmpR family regulator
MPSRALQGDRRRSATVVPRLRPVAEAEELVEVGDLSVDPHWHEVTRNGRTIQLTRLEFQLLYILAQNAERVVSYTSLIQAAWGFTADNTAQAILKTPISRLRSKVGLHPPGRLALSSVTRAGYVLTVVAM